MFVDESMKYVMRRQEKNKKTNKTASGNQGIHIDSDAKKREKENLNP